MNYERPHAFGVSVERFVICVLYLKPNIFISDSCADILSGGFEMKEFWDFELLHYEFL